MGTSACGDGTPMKPVVWRWTEMSDETRTTLEKLGMPFGIVSSVPLVAGARVIGAMNTGYDREEQMLPAHLEVLQAAGAHVSTARSVEEALAILETEVPDVVVADLGMPLVDGFQFIARVRRHHNPLVREVPAAALTAYARSEDRTTALRAGFQIHLAKPIDPAELVTTIASLARRFVIRPSDRPADLV